MTMPDPERRIRRCCRRCSSCSASAVAGVLVEAFLPRRHRYPAQLALAPAGCVAALWRSWACSPVHDKAPRSWAPSPSTGRRCSCRAQFC